MEYNKLIDDLLDILDKDENIINIKKVKTKLLNNLDFLSCIEKYKLSKDINDKKKLYENIDYVNYLKYETNINILIQSIKSKFKLVNRKCYK